MNRAYPLERSLRSAHMPEPVSATNFAGIYGILRRRLASIAVITSLSVVAALVYLSLASPVYTAKTTLLIDPRPHRMVTDRNVRSGLTDVTVLVESQVAIITSDAVLDRVIQALSLDKDSEFAPPPDATGPLQRAEEYIRGRREPLDARTTALENLSKALRATRAQRTYVIDIEANSNSALKAARIANAVASAYFADQAEAKSAAVRRSNELRDVRLNKLRRQVRIAETRIDEFRRANRHVTSDGVNVAEEKLGKLNAELAVARAAAAAASAKYAQVQESARGAIPSDKLPDTVKSQFVRQLLDRHAQATRRESSLKAQLHDRHPDLVDVRTQLREIAAQIKKEVGKVELAAKKEHDIAASRERELLRTIENTKAEAAFLSMSQIKLRELQREAKARRDLLAAFLARTEKALEQKDVSAPDVRIVSKAAVPSQPSRPSVLLILALGLLGGLGLGVARALAAGHLDRSIATESDLGRAGGLSLLAALPEVSRRGLLARFFDRSGARDGPPVASAHSVILSAIESPRGSSALAFRQAVLRLLDRVRVGVRPDQSPAVMVASPRGGAGSTATALGLAYAAAIAGDRVLLVDATSANPDLSQIFSRDLPEGERIGVDRKEDLLRILAHDSRSGMAILPAAYFDLRVLKADQRRRFVSGLTALASDFDLVVYDGGGLLDDDSAMTLQQAIDRFIVVARSGETTRSEMAQLDAILEPARDRVAGAVLNRGSF